MRLIDADALHATLDNCWSDDCFVFERYIDEAPTIDAVEIVRCRDCQYFRSAYYACDGYFCKPSCGLVNGLNIPNEDTFCSYGKKKE